MRTALPLILFLAALTAVTPTKAQLVRWPARYFHTGNGLPQNTVRDIVQDNEGWLWVSTDNGLCIYDGYIFYLVDQLEGGSKLERGMAHFIKDGASVWIFQKKIIARYDGATKRIAVYNVPVTHFNGTTPAYIDSTKIIYYTDKDGFQFDKATGKTVPMAAVPKENIFSRVQAVDLERRRLFLNDNYLVIPDKAKPISYLTKADLSKQTIVPTTQLPAPVYSLSKLDSSFLYLGSDNKLYFSKRSNDIPVSVDAAFTIQNKYEQLHQLKLNDNEFLIGAGTDIFHVTLKPAFAIRRVTQTDGSPLIHKGKMLCFIKDATNNIWIGTNAEGLIQVPISGNTFTLYRSPRPEKNFTRSIHVDTFTNNIWGSLYFDNIVVFDRYGLEQTPLTEQLQKLLGKHSVINYIHQLNKDEFIVFAEFDKTYHINLAKNTIVTCKTVFDDPVNSSIHNRSLSSIFFIAPLGKDRFLKLYDKSLVSLHYSQHTLHITRFVPMPSASSGIYMVNDNNFWVGVSSKALNIDSTGNFKDSLIVPGDRKVNAITRDKQFNYWVATDGGLFVFKNRQLIRTLSRKDGLPDDYFYTLITDTAGYVWGSTNMGLVQVDPRSFRFRSFTEKDGLQGNEFNTGAVHQAKDGRIFFGGISGINSFHPSDAGTGKQSLQVRFTSMVSGDSILFNALDPLPKSISLPAASGNIVVSFSVFNFFIPGGNEYEYRLADNKEWLSTAGRNVMQLFLTPGNYKLQVRLKDQPASVATMDLYIDPPFYRSWWFIMGVAVALLLIAGLIIYLFVREKYQTQINTLAMREKVQHEKERISRELHDDLGVKANLLSYNASLLIDHVSDGDSGAIGSRIKDAADDMLLALRETMWTLKQENITTNEVWVRFKNFISKMHRSYHHINFVITGDLFTDKLLAYNDALNLVRILQEAVNNSIRHSGTTSIYFSAGDDNGSILFTIRDEGKGFSETQIEPGDGLANMRHRSDQSGFGLTINSVAGEGTLVTVSV